MTEYPTYDSKKYRENEILKQQCMCDMLAAGIAEVFANRDRYTTSELGDMARIYFDSVSDLEELRQRFAERFENNEEEE